MTDYTAVLKQELILALGCTEPIAIALAAAHAGALIEEDFQSIKVIASGSIIKNANSVYVPNSNGLQGVLISAALGALTRKPELQLKVLEAVTQENRDFARDLISKRKVTLELAENVDNVYIKVEVRSLNHCAQAVISHAHTHLSLLVLDGETQFEAGKTGHSKAHLDMAEASLQEIYDFAGSVSFEEDTALKELLEQQIFTNLQICDDSLESNWGQEVGRTMMGFAQGRPELEAIALAAAGSDARMAGCDSPVTINAGSGNQGIACSVPVVRMAKALGSSHELLLRALVLSNLIALYEKQFIGKLSAFCGAVSASAAAGCGIAYLQGQGLKVIEGTLTNTLAASGGILCDGAKGSCAMKIAVALYNAFLGMEMAKIGHVFQAGDGLVGRTAEDTIHHIGTIAVEGMVPTDQTILKIITDQNKGHSC